MPLRRIARVGRLNKKKLLEFASQEANQPFSRIEQVRAYLGLETNEEAFEFLREQYNDYVPVENKRQRDLNNVNENISRQFKLLVETRDINEIVLNMNELRPHFTLEEILNRIILSYINEDEGNFYTIQIGDNHYTLNADVRNRLLNLVKRDLILEEETAHGSDVDILLQIKNVEQIIIKRWERTNTYETPDGAFFKYKNNTEMDFTKYGIFNNHGNWCKNGKKNKHISNYDDNCLVYALKEYCKTSNTLPLERVENVKRFAKNLKIPLNALPDVAKQLQHRIRVNNIDYEGKYNVYGKEFENEISLGLIDNHYFLNDTTNYTAFAIENYDDIKHIENFNYIYKVRIEKGVKYYRKDKNRCITAFNAVKLLLENKDKLLTKLTTQEKQLAYTQFYNSVDEDFDNLHYDYKKNTRPVVNKKKIGKVMLNMFMFDFETNTNEGFHKEYLCCIYYQDEELKRHGRKFIGYDCATQMLDVIPNNSFIIAHNATYDYTFVVKHLDRLNDIVKGNRLMGAEGYYQGKYIKIKDSYSLISYALKNFNENLQLGEDTEKEVISHNLYTHANIEKRFIDIDYALSFFKTDEEKEQFHKNIYKWNLVGENNTYDCLEYSANYCLKDCEILFKGYIKFRKMVIDSVNLNIDDILTIPSLSHNYFIREGCYNGVNEIGGIPQRFIQKSVIGGRCMTNSNLMILCYEISNALDAVSLYPSAMKKMGFLKGKPKPLSKHELCYDWLKEQDGYFVEIKIKDVGKKRHFPLMSYVDENGVRDWTNDMIGKTMIVNKITLEDLIEFQDIKFEILKGYYFNEGRCYKINAVIEYLYKERKKWKDADNPIQEIFKLIMNSGYGKMIMREIETQNIFFDNEASFQKFLTKNYNYINEFHPYGNGKYRVKRIIPFNQHFNLAHIGSELLSISKRIMNNVMCLAEDNGIFIRYTDTDCLHLAENDIAKLRLAYFKKYGNELIGDELGQFHSDFKIINENDKKEKYKDVVACKSLYLGKKSYLGSLRGFNVKYGYINDYHARMKGVMSNCVYIYADENNMKNDIWAVYHEMFEGKNIKFDLMKAGCLNFKYDKNYNIITDPIFTRELCFRGDRILLTEEGDIRNLKSTKDDDKKSKKKIILRKSLH